MTNACARGGYLVASLSWVNGGRWSVLLELGHGSGHAAGRAGVEDDDVVESHGPEEVRVIGLRSVRSMLSYVSCVQCQSVFVKSVKFVVFSKVQ